jgi:hypothetical protein
MLTTLIIGYLTLSIISFAVFVCASIVSNFSGEATEERMSAQSRKLGDSQLVFRKSIMEKAPTLLR